MWWTIWRRSKSWNKRIYNVRYTEHGYITWFPYYDDYFVSVMSTERIGPTRFTVNICRNHCLSRVAVWISPVCLSVTLINVWFSYGVWYRLWFLLCFYYEYRPPIVYTILCAAPYRCSTQNRWVGLICRTPLQGAHPSDPRPSIFPQCLLFLRHPRFGGE